MSSYLLHGNFGLREGIMQGFDDEPESQGILLAWGLWEMPQADNDDEFDPPLRTA